MGNLSQFAKMKTASDEEIRETMEEIEAKEAERIAEYDKETEFSELKSDMEYDSANPMKAAGAAAAEEKVNFEEGDYVKFSVTMTTNDMFRFFMRHTYFSISGVVGLLIGIAAIVILCTGMMSDNLFASVMLGVIAAMYTLVNPITSYFRAKTQVKALYLSGEPYTYTFGEKGLMVAQGEQSVPMKWNNVMKIREGKSSYYVYLAANRAFVLPKESMGEEREHFENICSTYAPAGKVKFKKA